jgi:hypothetical protein
VFGTRAQSAVSNQQEIFLKYQKILIISTKFSFFADHFSAANFAYITNFAVSVPFFNGNVNTWLKEEVQPRPLTMYYRPHQRVPYGPLVSRPKFINASLEYNP